MFLAHIAGILESKPIDDAVSKLNAALPVMNETAFVPMNLLAYLGTSFVMGAILLAGSIMVIFRQSKGMVLIFSYYALFALMFLNFQILNEKVVHLLVGLGIAGLLYFLIRTDKTASKSEAMD